MTEIQKPKSAKGPITALLVIVVVTMFLVSLWLLGNDWVRFPSEEVDANATVAQGTIEALLSTNLPPSGIAAADYEATLVKVPKTQAVWLRQTATAIADMSNSSP